MAQVISFHTRHEIPPEGEDRRHTTLYELRTPDGRYWCDARQYITFWGQLEPGKLYSFRELSAFSLKRLPDGSLALPLPEGRSRYPAYARFVVERLP